MNTVLTTSQLKTLNEKAMKLKFNRVLNIQDAFSTEGEVLKENGKHILSVLLWPHCNASGLVSCRCIVFMAVEGSDDPCEAILDISTPDYKRLFGQTRAKFC